MPYPLNHIRHHPYFIRLVLITLGTFILAIALWVGLVRIGWDFPPLRYGLPAEHGPFIVCGFVGTFFGLERAVALNKTFAYVISLIIVLAGLAFLVAPQSKFCPMIVVTGSLGFLILCGILFFRQPTYYSAFIFLGSFHWLVANVIWLSAWPVYTAVLWWMSFVLFTTTGERIELMRMGHLKLRARIEIGLGVLLVFLGHVTIAVSHHLLSENLLELHLYAIFDPRVKIGMVVAGWGILLTAIWFIRNDLARRSLGKPGLAGYIAFCLMSAYVWLAVNGVLCIWFAGLVSGYAYDSFIHTFFIGFLFFMIFGHAPILVPAYLNLFLTMEKWFYGPPILLHLSLAIRIAGDLTHSSSIRKWGSIMNGASIVLFLAMLGTRIVLENRRKGGITELSGRNHKSCQGF